MTHALHHATPARRVELLDAASAAVCQMQPRPCGLTRCPVDCEACMRAWARAILWLSRLPDPLPRPVYVEVYTHEVRPTQVIDPGRVAEVLRQWRAP